MKKSSDQKQVAAQISHICFTRHKKKQFEYTSSSIYFINNINIIVGTLQYSTVWEMRGEAHINGLLFHVFYLNFKQHPKLLELCTLRIASPDKLET